MNSFTPGMVEECFDLKIVNDQVGEPTEVLIIGVRLQGSSDMPTTTRITIVDDDGMLITLTYLHDHASCVSAASSTAVSISFKNPSYTETEQDGVLMVCLMLNLVSSENTTVFLEAVPGSASPGHMPLV